MYNSGMYFATLASTFSYFWLAWLIVFLIIEGIAMKLSKSDGKPQDDGTLSNLVWGLRKGNRFFGIVLGLFWIVLGFHFFFYSGS